MSKFSDRNVEPRRTLRCWLAVALMGITLAASANAVAADKAEPPVEMPFIDGPFWQVAGDPDLGKYTTERQQPVDFAVWQAADGTWQLWSCIRRTSAGGTGRVFHGWEGKNLTDKNWRPLGVVMESEPEYGETPAGLQAPHVVKEGDTYYMLYGDWENICLATSKDGKKFEKYVQPNGKTGLFTEGAGANTRDIAMIKIGDRWFGYYTAFPSRQGAVYVRTTKDFKNWSESTNVAFGGRAGVNPFAAECPHVVEHNGRYYLFRTQKYGEQARTSVYSSTDPMNFGLNQDRLFYVGEMPIAAPELIIQHEGQDYIAVLLPNLKGIQIAKLGWTKPPKPESAVLDLSNKSQQGKWKVTEGKLPEIFSSSNRDQFNAPNGVFIGTAETGSDKFDDKLTATIESPEFEIDSPWLFAYVAGGTDREKLYVAIVDAEKDIELARVTPAHQGNAVSPELINTSPLMGRKVKLRVVDNSTGSWGHINFGGLYRGK